MNINRYKDSIFLGIIKFTYPTQQIRLNSTKTAVINVPKNPSIVIADEPTGNLDSKNSLEIMNIIKAISKEKLVILVTHEVDLAKFYATRVVELQDGKIVNDYSNESKESLEYRLDNKIYLKDFKAHMELQGTQNSQDILEK